MTVGELVAHLQKLPQDVEAQIEHSETSEAVETFLLLPRDDTDPYSQPILLIQSKCGVKIL